LSGHHTKSSVITIRSRFIIAAHGIAPAHGQGL